MRLINVFVLISSIYSLSTGLQAQDKGYSLSYFAGKTPFNNNNVSFDVIKFGVEKELPYLISGINVSLGKYQGVFEFSDTNWVAVGPYWDFWQSGVGRFSFEFAPTYIDNDFIAGHFVAGRWHFTSTLEYTFTPQFSQPFQWGIRYQHTSNGGTGSPNPGIDGVGAFVELKW
ncbi:acyloxyacyl hydrolase [Alteromonas sp. 5E99-2]|uniref:acyloxyacyl hydrolase n=1 Tax=Alteromonas sp. 5E99-2 TaxID=2817683 RepID=UPI001A99993C|nr:acyloxyacyl hydrolase [Alteromonas sp. 5E99-2]MBO1255937.1 acyloxyacyl hydrolase [Alteromonas sp. 5E99-2]